MDSHYALGEAYKYGEGVEKDLARTTLVDEREDLLCDVVMKGGEKCPRRGECWTFCDTHRQQLNRGLDQQAKGGVAKSAIWNIENDAVRARTCDQCKARDKSLAGRKRKRKPDWIE